ncbi:MAG: YajG family lipoprotein [Aquabacterium sp.]|nr:YajG family lipoprotein [Aquabacterium sp.]
MRIHFVFLLSVLLAGCSTTRVGMTYSPPSASQTLAGIRPVDVGSFLDQRGEPATWLGAIRGGFGNPLKTLESDVPVSKLVQDAFSSALKARGATIATSSPELQFSGVIKKLFCNQVVQREANVEIEVQVTEISSKRVLLSRTYSATNYESAFFATGVFASTDDLRALTERTLREVIEQALNDSSMRLALAR